MRLFDTNQRFEIAGVIGLAGGAVALALAGGDRHLSLDWGFFRVACAGAFVAGLLVADGFGHRGWRGALGGGVSFAIATVVGAIVAFFLMPVESLLTGVIPIAASFGPLHIGDGLIAPVFVVGSVLGSVPVAIVWAGGAVLTHWVAVCHRDRLPGVASGRINP